MLLLYPAGMALAATLAIVTGFFYQHPASVSLFQAFIDHATVTSSYLSPILLAPLLLLPHIGHDSQPASRLASASASATITLDSCPNLDVLELIALSPRCIIQFSPCAHPLLFSNEEASLGDAPNDSEPAAVVHRDSPDDVSATPALLPVISSAQNFAMVRSLAVYTGNPSGVALPCHSLALRASTSVALWQRLNVNAYLQVSSASSRMSSAGLGKTAVHGSVPKQALGAPDLISTALLGGALFGGNFLVALGFSFLVFCLCGVGLFCGMKRVTSSFVPAVSQVTTTSSDPAPCRRDRHTKSRNRTCLSVTRDFFKRVKGASKLTASSVFESLALWPSTTLWIPPAFRLVSPTAAGPSSNGDFHTGDISLPLSTVDSIADYSALDIFSAFSDILETSLSSVSDTTAIETPYGSSLVAGESSDIDHEYVDAVNKQADFLEAMPTASVTDDSEEIELASSTSPATSIASVTPGSSPPASPSLSSSLAAHNGLGASELAPAPSIPSTPTFVSPISSEPSLPASPISFPPSESASHPIPPPLSSLSSEDADVSELMRVSTTVTPVSCLASASSPTSSSSPTSTAYHNSEVNELVSRPSIPPFALPTTLTTTTPSPLPAPPATPTHSPPILFPGSPASSSSFTFSRTIHDSDDQNTNTTLASPTPFSETPSEIIASVSPLPSSIPIASIPTSLSHAAHDDSGSNSPAPEFALPLTNAISIAPAPSAPVLVDSTVPPSPAQFPATTSAHSDFTLQSAMPPLPSPPAAAPSEVAQVKEFAPAPAEKEGSNMISTTKVVPTTAPADEEKPDVVNWALAPPVSKEVTASGSAGHPAVSSGHVQTVKPRPAKDAWNDVAQRFHLAMGENVRDRMLGQTAKLFEPSERRELARFKEEYRRSTAVVSTPESPAPSMPAVSTAQGTQVEIAIARIKDAMDNASVHSTSTASSESVRSAPAPAEKVKPATVNWALASPVNQRVSGSGRQLTASGSLVPCSVTPADSADNAQRVKSQQEKDSDAWDDVSRRFRLAMGENVRDRMLDLGSKLLEPKEQREVAHVTGKEERCRSLALPNIPGPSASTVNTTQAQMSQTGAVRMEECLRSLQECLHSIARASLPGPSTPTTRTAQGSELTMSVEQLEIARVKEECLRSLAKTPGPESKSAPPATTTTAGPNAGERYSSSSGVTHVGNCLLSRSMASTPTPSKSTVSTTQDAELTELRERLEVARIKEECLRSMLTAKTPGNTTAPPITTATAATNTAESSTSAPSSSDVVIEDQAEQCAQPEEVSATATSDGVVFAPLPVEANTTAAPKVEEEELSQRLPAPKSAPERVHQRFDFNAVRLLVASTTTTGIPRRPDAATLTRKESGKCREPETTTQTPLTVEPHRLGAQLMESSSFVTEAESVSGDDSPVEQCKAECSVQAEDSVVEPRKKRSRHRTVAQLRASKARKFAQLPLCEGDKDAQ